MTCIVGVAEKGKVYIGGDSAGVSGNDIRIRADEKVFRNGDFIFGFTSSFRMGQILRYNFKPPKRAEGITDEEYLHRDFISAVIKILKTYEYAELENNIVKGGVFLFGYKGKIYYVGEDFQIGTYMNKYESVGCGKQYASGALYALEKYELKVEVKIKIALEAAETFSTGVRRPFKIISN